jgi:ubiquitin-conjugating enzyme E2 B
MCFEAIIIGPDDTEWEGGIFKLIIEFGEKFPSAPPKVKFLT